MLQASTARLFFSTLAPWGKRAYSSVHSRSTSQGIKALTVLKNVKMNLMQTKYPHIMEEIFHGKVVYTLQSVPPEKMIQDGGLRAGEDLWFSNTGSGKNSGSICFSLLPEITTLFFSSLKNGTTPHRAYLYAFPLIGSFLLPGSKWREVISPGAFPLPPWWVVRELKEIRHESQVLLGPLKGVPNCQGPYIRGEHFDKYCHNRLISPPALDYGEDHPLEYNFTAIDTPFSAHFQQKVNKHYREVQENQYPFSGIKAPAISF